MKKIIEYNNMTLEKEGKRAWLTFHREHMLNAVGNESNAQFSRIAAFVREDPDIRMLIIRGRGRAFSTGLDLKEYAAGKIGTDYYHSWDESLRVLEMMEKIVIVGMQGYCLGGALQLALASDIRISTPDCLIGLPAIKESIIPGMGPWRLARYVGMGRAKRLTLGGENISGEEALGIGLVDYLTDPALSEEDFFIQVDRIAEKYLAVCSSGTRMSKIFLNSTYHLDFEDAFDVYKKLQYRAHMSPDAQEAKAAYQEKRQPQWL